MTETPDELASGRCQFKEPIRDKRLFRNLGRPVPLPSRTGRTSRADGLGGIFHFPTPPHPAPQARLARIYHLPGAAVSSLRSFTALRHLLPPVSICLGFRMRLGIPTY